MLTLRNVRSIAITGALVALAARAVPLAEQSTPRSAPEPLHVNGLERPVDVLRDRWGINHIYAQNEHDLFFAQGYNAAKDRLFQFEIWRRQATGTVAEVLGRRELKRDIGTRLHQFRGDLKTELNWYHPHGEAIINAFVDGINAAVAEALRKPEELPLDFKILGIKPQKWTPAVVISRHNGLLGNITQEVNMAQAVRIMGADKVKDLSDFYGGDPRLEVDPAIDLSLINRNILELYNAFREPIRFTPDEVVAEYRGAAAAVARLDDALGPSAVDLSLRREDIGSNNWVVSGRLTQSGRPLLMNDPHRVQEAPSLRYWSHLVAPGWNVIGGGEPMLPGVSIGHNEVGAWGLTIFGTDGEDLYVYETNPANANQIRYRGAWEDMRIVKDTIAVKGEAPVAVELKYTRHGPVLYEDAAHHRAYALRAAWMETGSAPYLASLRMDQAKSWEEFRDACSYSRIPAENMVWADMSGTIGYQAVAITPIRRELQRPRAGARRRTLRMGRLPADQGAAERDEPREGLLGDREQLPVSARLSVSRCAAPHRHRPVPRLADQRGARHGPPPHRRRHDGTAERRPVAARARAGAALARRADRRRRRRQERATRCSGGTTSSTRTRCRRASTRCGSGGSSPTCATWSCPPRRATCSATSV